MLRSGLWTQRAVRRRVPTVFAWNALRSFTSTAREQYKAAVTGGFKAQQGSEQAERLLRPAPDNIVNGSGCEGKIFSMKRKIMCANAESIANRSFVSL